jgi:S1-C subfamily serine protease
MLRSFTTVVSSVVLSLSLVVGFAHYVPDAGYSQVREATHQLVSEFGSCSAVAIKPDVLLTAAHCDAPELRVGRLNGVVVKKDESKDLMLVYVAGLNSQVLSVAKAMPGLDEKVALAGFPLGVGEVVTEGRVQSLTTLAPDHLALVSAPGVFGNSGGPVVVRRGMHYEVVGVVSMIVVAPISMGMFAIPNIVPHLMLVVNATAINSFLS